MKFEIDVIRLSNEDVIATSCENALTFYYVNGDDSYGLFNKKFREGFSTDQEALNSKDFQEVLEFFTNNEEIMYELYTKPAGHYYHVLPNGNIEECNNPSYHDDWWSLLD